VLDNEKQNQPRDSRIDIRINKILKQRVLAMLESVSPKVTLSQYVIDFLTTHVEKHEVKNKNSGGK